MGLLVEVIYITYKANKLYSWVKNERGRSTLRKMPVHCALLHGLSLRRTTFEGRDWIVVHLRAPASKHTMTRACSLWMVGKQSLAYRPPHLHSLKPMCPKCLGWLWACPAESSETLSINRLLETKPGDRQSRIGRPSRLTKKLHL